MLLKHLNQVIDNEKELYMQSLIIKNKSMYPSLISRPTVDKNARKLSRKIHDW